MKRREFIILMSSGMLAWPLAARAQSSSLPVIGFLNIASPGPFATFLAAFHKGLNARDYVEGKNVAIDYRWAEGDRDRLQLHAADLVRQQVAVIVATGGTVSAKTAKNATQTIPIVFVIGNDPVSEGLVSSISRPGGNTTGVSLISTELLKKRMEQLRTLLPKARKIAVLLHPQTPSAQSERLDAQKVAEEARLELLILEASNENDLETAFESAVKAEVGALIVTADGFYTSRRAQIVALAARHKLPTAYPWRQYPDAGGLMSYGPRITDAYRQAGDYIGRILKGTKPADLPVQLPTVFDLVLNLKTAKALGIQVPYPLLSTATEVIE
jgi:putative tryptophan/tyrosine transport system substrate-binding protein